MRGEIKVNVRLRKVGSAEDLALSIENAHLRSGGANLLGIFSSSWCKKAYHAMKGTGKAKAAPATQSWRISHQLPRPPRLGVELRITDSQHILD